ncbi:MAG: 5-formyltetrahydrofolate cyclo-ligase [Candidatus Omnitrophota bacterium]
MSYRYKTKREIRKEIYKKLAAQPPSLRGEKSRAIKEKLFQEKAFQKATCVMFYVSMDEEVDTCGMIDDTLKMGKRVCVPVIMEHIKELKVSEVRNRLEDLERGRYGIYQPKESCERSVPLNDIDVIIVPGVAFDKKNGRIGRGQGYYDRFLRQLPPDTKKIGLAFDFQVAESLPTESHDVPLDEIITA